MSLVYSIPVLLDKLSTHAFNILRIRLFCAIPNINNLFFRILESVYYFRKEVRMHGEAETYVVQIDKSFTSNQDLVFDLGL